jgi:hypothetical protein
MTMPETATKIDVEQIARVCHEANRGLQAAQQADGIPVAPTWDEFPPDQQEGVRRGVTAALAGATPEELHRAWCSHKYDEGWRYGPEKDAEAKRHPCLVPYDELPEEQRVKDTLFRAIVFALS